MNMDISVNPVIADAIEHFALEECVKRKRLNPHVSALVAPGDRYDSAIKLARLGASVRIADHAEKQRFVEGRILAGGCAETVNFTPFSLSQDIDGIDGEPFDIIMLHRGLCALPYDEARRMLRKLLFKLKIGGKLYITVLGLHSELGDAYPGSELPVQQRFAPLAPGIAEKYALPDPLCLYTERNLFLLLLEAGASVLRTLTTTYGNVQGIAVRV